jgi:hypothetical protein
VKRPGYRARKYIKKTLAEFRGFGMFSLHFRLEAQMAAFGATDNCSPHRAQE